MSEHITPKDKAREIMHRLFKKEGVSAASAIKCTITVSKLMIEEAEFSNNPKAISYWKEVKKEAKNL